MKRYLFIILIWLWLTLALLALFIRQVPPFQFMDLKSLVLFIESSKFFFIIILFPLIASRLSLGTNPVIASDCEERSNLSYLLNCLKPFAIFLLLSLPLTIMASHLGHTDWGILLRANLLLLLMAVFLTLLFIKLPEKYSTIYYLAIFIIYGIGPILYYLVLELAGASWRFLVLLNPFWLFWQANNPEVFYSDWLVQCLVWAGLIIITLAINRISKEKSVATKALRTRRDNPPTPFSKGE